MFDGHHAVCVSLGVVAIDLVCAYVCFFFSSILFSTCSPFVLLFGYFVFLHAQREYGVSCVVFIHAKYAVCVCV